jgi:hypothetical protein
MDAKGLRICYITLNKFLIMKMRGLDFYAIREKHLRISHKKLHCQIKLSTSYMTGTIHRTLNHDSTTTNNNMQMTNLQITMQIQNLMFSF